MQCAEPDDDPGSQRPRTRILGSGVRLSELGDEINDEKLDSEDTLLTDEITEDALNAMRFLPGEVTSAIETSLARVYDVDADELAGLLFPED